MLKNIAQLYFKLLNKPYWNKNAKITCIEHTDSSISVLWDKVSGKNIQNYVLYCNGQVVARLAANVQSYTVTGLDRSTNYMFKVEACYSKTETKDGPYALFSTRFEPSDKKIVRKIVFKSGDGYPNYRIPGIVATAKGTLIAVAEARKTYSDWADMDAVIIRSEDNGETWSKPFVAGNGIARKTTVNNPTLLAAKKRRYFLVLL